MSKPLEGGIAKQVAKGLKGAKMTMSATLTRVTPGARGATVSGGTNPTETTFGARGFVESRTYKLIEGVSVQANDRVYAILGASISGGQRPVASDKLTIDGETFRLEAVGTDPARAVYLCLARK